MASEEKLLEKIKKYLEDEEGDIQMKLCVFREDDESVNVEEKVGKGNQEYKISLRENNECEVKHHEQKNKENKFIFILFCNDVLSHYVSLSLKGKICYIDKLDSTGYIKGISKDLMKSILSTVNKEIICCFSHPKPSFIFNLNSKKIMNSQDLACFWIEIFKTKCDKIQVWSNNFDEFKRNHPNITKGYPYKTNEDLEYFKDDPKTRIREKLDVNLEKMFEIMLCRNDFIEGSLVYGTIKTLAKMICMRYRTVIIQ
ncbi:hypothetical protein NBO_29g0026 [Nosema bombycis CQ1]|uniref:histone acetyltransferase n=1 Tax=Nosema bombycis (strain CQ1 / CVCC 102059) TaxID=578461 RepID=R0M8Q9_NOSB1|nr:hypothetical protein NBO_29g0026 [Nosema bombycis CQ1]|eukprot:EOB14344.1 hypothetical protein NBO_29g0026 [Nosema bombycis CQ1]